MREDVLRKETASFFTLHNLSADRCEVPPNTPSHFPVEVQGGTEIQVSGTLSASPHMHSVSHSWFQCAVLLGMLFPGQLIRSTTPALCCVLSAKSSAIP